MSRGCYKSREPLLDEDGNVIWYTNPEGVSYYLINTGYTCFTLCHPRTHEIIYVSHKTSKRGNTLYTLKV